MDFAEESRALPAFAVDGLVDSTKDEINVTEIGRLFIRNVAMVFDEYLTRPKGEFLFQDGIMPKRTRKTPSEIKRQAAKPTQAKAPADERGSHLKQSKTPNFLEEIRKNNPMIEYFSAA